MCAFDAQTIQEVAGQIGIRTLPANAVQREDERGTRSMQIYVARLNIEQFRRQIAAGAEPKKLEILRRLLAEEEAKLVRLLTRGVALL